MWTNFRRLLANDAAKVETLNNFKQYFDNIMVQLNLVNK